MSTSGAVGFVRTFAAGTAEPLSAPPAHSTNGRIVACPYGHQHRPDGRSRRVPSRRYGSGRASGRGAAAPCAGSAARVLPGVAAGRRVAVQRGLMASADEGDASRLRIGGWVPESEVDSGDGSLESAVTQLIPVVRDDDAPQVPGRRVGSDPVQRAVARRAPAPLPDLGRGDAPAEPRRRRAAAGATVADAPAGELPAAFPGRAAAALDRTVLPRALPTQAEPLDGDDFREDAPTQADPQPDPADPLTPTASAPSRGKPPPEGSPGPAVRPVPTGHTSPSARPGPAAHSGPAAPAGPTVLPADTRDTDPEIGSTDEPYHGRRRAVAPAGRLWAFITLVLVGLGAAIAIPLATTSSPGGGDPLTLGVPTTSLAPGDHPLPGAEESAAATASPTASVAPRSPSPSDRSYWMSTRRRASVWRSSFPPLAIATTMLR